MSIRRGLMMGMGNGTNYNVLKGLSYEPGYINASGGISTQSATYKEIIYDYLDISEIGTNELLFALQYGVTSFDFWIAYGEYDANKTFLRRTSMPSPGNLSSSTDTRITPFKTSSDCKYIRLSYRTFGNSNAVLIRVTDAIQAFTNSGTLPIHLTGE